MRSEGLRVWGISGAMWWPGERTDFGLGAWSLDLQIPREQPVVSTLG